MCDVCIFFCGGCCRKGVQKFIMSTKVASKHEIDMTEGKLLPKIIAFALPLLLTSVLQLLFNSADMIVVGKFVGDDAVGAVGSTGSLSALIINLAIGFSGGAGVVLASAYGAKDRVYADKVLHTSMTISIISGFLIGALGFFCARPLLTLMGTTEAQIDYAITYIEIIFLGSPFNMVYNFGASMLRATGDTKRPLIYLTVSGVLNIGINIFTVAVLKMGVAGVAVATIFSQAVSSVMVVVALLKSQGFVRLSFRKLRIDKRAFVEILRLGIPTAIQSSLFNITNVMLQSAVNGFGKDVVTGSAVSGQIEGYIYAINAAISTTALTVVGQNYGKKDYERIRRTVNLCVVLVTAVSVVASGLAIAFHEPLCKLFTHADTPEQTELIVGYAFTKMLVICSTYFLDGIMEVVTYSLRGIGYSITSMLIVLVGVCVYRILWMFVVFPLYPEYWFLFLMYPISWLITLSVAWIWLAVKIKKDGAKVHDMEVSVDEEHNDLLAARANV